MGSPPKRDNVRVWIKEGVYGDLCPELRKGLGKVQKYCESLQEPDFFITSMREGNHMHGSFHYDGRAVDFMHPLTVDSVEELKEAAGPGFDFVTFEVAHQKYIHMEYDPK